MIRNEIPSVFQIRAIILVFAIMLLPSLADPPTVQASVSITQTAVIQEKTETSEAELATLVGPDDMKFIKSEQGLPAASHILGELKAKNDVDATTFRMRYVDETTTPEKVFGKEYEEAKQKVPQDVFDLLLKNYRVVVKHYITDESFDPNIKFYDKDNKVKGKSLISRAEQSASYNIRISAHLCAKHLLVDCGWKFEERKKRLNDK